MLFSYLYCGHSLRRIFLWYNSLTKSIPPVLYDAKLASRDSFANAFASCWHYYYMRPSFVLDLFNDNTWLSIIITLHKSEFPLAAIICAFNRLRIHVTLSLSILVISRERQTKYDKRIACHEDHIVILSLHIMPVPTPLSVRASRKSRVSWLTILILHLIQNFS